MIDLTPDRTENGNTLFNIELPRDLPAFSQKTDFVPDTDPHYSFDPLTTKIISLGLLENKRVFIHGSHGTGKSTHIEQVAARLNWPCLRINLDGHLTRSDLIGRDAITLKEGQQVTSFKDGLLTYAVRRPCILVLDEYDAGRPEVMFVIQRLLEEGGKLTLTETGEVIRPHPYFRLFATANTVGTGDVSGIYHGTQYINQGQMDRWSLTVKLDYLAPEIEAKIIADKVPSLKNETGKKQIQQMVNLANMTRNAFKAGEIMGLLSLRTLIEWASNGFLLMDIKQAFCLSFLNRQDPEDRPKIAEFYQRCFGEDLSLS